MDVQVRLAYLDCPVRKVTQELEDQDPRVILDQLALMDLTVCQD